MIIVVSSITAQYSLPAMLGMHFAVQNSALPSVKGLLLESWSKSPSPIETLIITLQADVETLSIVNSKTLMLAGVITSAELYEDSEE